MTGLTIQTYPPLGQISPFRTGQLKFCAVLNDSTNQIDEFWEVSLWHSIDGAEWAGAQLVPVRPEDVPTSLHHDASSSTCCYYEGSFEFKQSMHFTLTYRKSKGSAWAWSRDECGLGDGTVVLQATAALSEDLKDLIKDLNPEWKVSSCLSQTPRTLLWSLCTKSPIVDSTLGGQSGDVSTYRDIAIGGLKEGHSR